MANQDLAELKGRYLDPTGVSHEKIILPIKREDFGKVVEFLKSEEKNPESKFVKACEAVKIKPTRRQASKWLRRKGKAWTNGRFQDEGGE